jgi:hypothetical protein
MNMPYTAVAKYNRLAILSTFQSRIVVVEPRSLTLIKDFVPPGQDWSYVEKLLRDGTLAIDDISETFRHGYREDDPYWWEHGPHPLVLGESFGCHFGGLVNGRHFLSMPKFDGILNSRGIYYFLDSYKGEKGNFLFSSSSRQLLYLAQAEDAAYAIPYSLAGHPWRIGTQLATPSGLIPVLALERKATEVIDRIRSARIGRKIIPWATFTEEVLMPYLESTDVPKTKDWLVEQLHNLYNGSHAGQRFISSYLDCSVDSCAIEEVQRRADQVLQEIKTQRSFDLERLILPCMLASMPCNL